MKNSILIILFLIIPKILLSQENPDNNIDMLLLKGKYQEVINILEPLVVQKDSLPALTYFNLGLAYQQLYKNDEAVKMFTTASRLESNNSTYLYTFGKSLLGSGISFYAYSVFKETLEKDPNHLSAKIELGKLCLELRKYEEAELLFKELTNTDSTNAYFFQKLGYTNLKLGNKEKAIKYYKKSLGLKTHDPVTILQLATIYFKNENFEAAYKLLLNCIEIHVSNLPLNRLMGEVVFKIKKYKSSVVQYEHLITIGDSTDINYQKLGFSYYFISQSNFTADSLKDANLNLAIENLLKAKSLNKLDPITSLYLGICYKELKDFDSAIFHLKESADLLFPGYTSDVFTHLGISYEYNNDFGNAIKNYLCAYEFNPENKTLLFSIASAMDRFYEDRKTPRIYYKTFLNKYKMNDQNLISYAEERIEKLTEENHFRHANK